MSDDGRANEGGQAEPDLPEEARLAFARPWIFVRGVPSMRFLPPEGPAEIAFAGRSNVGKSSLINALVGVGGLARTSNTPGRTQELNFFVPDGVWNPDSGPRPKTKKAKAAYVPAEPGVDEDGNLVQPPLALVDMPGYGFAQAPKSQVDAWTKLIFAYLRGRSTLERVFVLIDARHGVKANDAEVLDLLDKAAVSYRVVLTKADKLGPGKLASVEKSVLAAIAKRPAAYPGILSTSSEKGIGLDALRAAIWSASQGLRE